MGEGSTVMTVKKEPCPKPAGGATGIRDLAFMHAGCPTHALLGVRADLPPRE